MQYLVVSLISCFLIPYGIYLILSREVIKSLVGFSALSHGVNLFVICCGKIDFNGMPFKSVKKISETANPLPQALILTSIVIGTALFAILVNILRKKN